MIHHCWNCGAEIDTETAEECPECHWFICPECGSCGCDYYIEVEDEESYRERKGVYGIDYTYEDE